MMTSLDGGARLSASQNISSIQGSAPSQGKQLSVDEVITRLELEMNRVDQSLNGYLNQVENNRLIGESSNEAIRKLSEMSQGGTAVLSAAQVRQLKSEPFSSVQDPEAKALIERFITDHQKPGTPTKSVPNPSPQSTEASKESVSALIGNLRDRQQDLSNASETMSIRLQSTVQQRSRLITLATNISSAMNDSLKAIANNIRG